MIIVSRQFVGPAIDLPQTRYLSGFNAVTQIFRVIDEQSQGTFDEDFNIVSYYNWTGLPGRSIS